MRWNVWSKVARCFYVYLDYQYKFPANRMTKHGSIPCAKCTIEIRQDHQFHIFAHQYVSRIVSLCYVGFSAYDILYLPNLYGLECVHKGVR